jgi:plastocyanin
LHKSSELSKLVICILAITLATALSIPLNAYALGGKEAFPFSVPIAGPAKGLNTTLPVGQSPTTRDIIVEWMETQSGQDRFNPEFIVVNQEDTVSLVFINNDTVAHDFVIGPPYDILVNASVPGLYNDVTGQKFTTPALHNSPGVIVTGTPGNVSASYSFVARYAGIYEYVCTYHIDVGMIGYLVVLAPPSSNTSQVQSNATTQTGQQSPSTTQVSIDAGSGVNTSSPGYTPVDVTVVMGVNNTVVWTNNDNMAHTVTGIDGSFDSGNMNPGKSFVHTFTKTGVFAYTCTYHNWMHGTVTVLSGEGSSPPQSAGDFTVVLTGHEIYGIISFGIVIVVALMLIFTKQGRKHQQASSNAGS